MRTSELRSICQKGAGELFLVSVYVYRPFTIYISRLYLLLKIRSNTVTLHSLAAGLIAVGFVLSSAPIYLVLAASFLQLYYVLDHVDGEVARFDIHRGHEKPSLAGSFFDFWTHLHTVNLLFAFMGLGLFLQTGNLLWAILGILACNISGNFQRSTLASVILCAAARGQINIRDPKFEPALDACCDLSRSKRFSETLPLNRRIYLLLSEAFGYPGNVLALTVVLLGDGILGLGEPGFHLLRSSYLIVYCGYGILSKTARTVVTLRQLRAAAD